MSLTLKNLSKSFGDKVIFTNLSYEFKDTGLYLIKGESGAGKTTLLRIIAGLDKSYGGTVEGGGFGKVSYSFQEYRLFEQLTALENLLVALPDKASDKEAKRASDLLKRLRFSEGELSLLPSELSGGMKQRVSFARAIMKKAPILILDEPTKELDGELVAILRNIIAEEAKERLVLLVSHENEDSAFSDYTVISL